MEIAIDAFLLVSIQRARADRQTKTTVLATPLGAYAAVRFTE
jgi:hypothetical protein